MEKHQYPYRPQFVEFMKGLFDLAVTNKEADSYDVLANGLPLIYPTNDSSMLPIAARYFSIKHTREMSVRFYKRHRIVREYVFENDDTPVPPAQVSEPAAEPQQQEKEQRNPLTERTVEDGKFVALLFDAAAEALGEFVDAAVTTAELADVRGELLDAYERRLEEQQKVIELYRSAFGDLPKGEPGIFETFSNSHYFGMRINKALAKKCLFDVLDFFQMINGQSFPGFRKKKRFHKRKKHGSVPAGSGTAK